QLSAATISERFDMAREYCGARRGARAERRPPNRRGRPSRPCASLAEPTVDASRRCCHRIERATSSMHEGTMYETRNDLQESLRKGVVQLLNDRLAEAIDLQLQAKHAHWNVKGPNFVGLHDLFDRVADAASEYVDLIAERGVALGGVAEGTVQTVSRRSKLPEYAASSGDWTAHVEAMRTA